ncbi:MAG: hypothetical protein WC895_03945 [Candidatus Shapirobacteria bacterium]|jgi:hypothetical protein
MIRLDYPFGIIWVKTEITVKRQFSENGIFIGLLKKDSIYFVNFFKERSGFYCQKDDWQDSLDLYYEVKDSITERRFQDYLQKNRDIFTEYLIKELPWFLE